MGDADYYAPGQWNFYCDLCGKKAKSSMAMKTWDNFYVCKHHKEVRNPQDFLRGIRDNQSVPWNRSKSVDLFVPVTCSAKTSTAIPHIGLPGCIRPGNVNMAWLPSDPDPVIQGSVPLEGLNGLPGFGLPGASIPSYNHEQPFIAKPELDTYEGIY